MDLAAAYASFVAFLHAWPLTNAFAVSFGSIVVALVVSFIHKRLFNWITNRTKTELDDILVGNTRLPVAVSILVLGFEYALTLLTLPAPIPYLCHGTLLTIMVGAWTFAASRMVSLLLHWLLERRDRYRQFVNSRTEPLFDIVGKTVVYGGGVYFVFLAWDIDVTGWLASAGIIGVAVGFAAQNTLGNFIAGIVILAEAPYKLGDFLQLETGERGRVTEIGLRATRILTHDDVEIVVPNSLMANSRIVNASGGPWEKYRASTMVSASYDADIDLVREVLLSCAVGVVGVASEPSPAVQFVSFGASGLDFKLMVWVERPGLAPTVVDRLNTNIFKAFRAAGLEIPYQKVDVHILRQAAREVLREEE